MISSCPALIFCVLLALTQVQSATWAVNNRQITKDGSTFTIKGVHYSPVPPSTMAAIGPNDWDTFHADWANLHDRDLPLMRAAGINTIIVRGWRHNYYNSNTNINHKPFLDKLYNNGVDPIFIVITTPIWSVFSYASNTTTRPITDAHTFQTTDGKWFMLADEEIYAEQRQIASDQIFATAIGAIDHPAVMGFSLGHEANDFITRSNCKFWEWLDTVAQRIKNHIPNGADKLTLTSILDDNMVTVAEASKCNTLTHLDAWGVNFKRGNVSHDFETLFNAFAASSTKPLLITEFGLGASAPDAEGVFAMLPENSLAQAEYFKVHWEAMMNSGVCSGGFVFGWVDEWSVYDNTRQDLPRAPLYPWNTGLVDDEAFGVMALFVDCTQLNNSARTTDVLLPRSIYYMMAKLFGARSDIPTSAYVPITYHRSCDDFVLPPLADHSPVTEITPSTTPETMGPISVPLSAPWVPQVTATVTLLLKVPPSLVDVGAFIDALLGLLDLPQNAILSANVDIDRSTHNTTVVQFVVQNVLRDDGTRVDPVAVALELRNLIATSDRRITESQLLRGMEVIPNEAQVSSAERGALLGVLLPLFLFAVTLKVIS